jgi:transcription initiation factor IIE alpha subunit
MEDKRQYFECEQCAAEFFIETDMDLEVEWCAYCGEPLDKIDWEYDNEDVRQESEGS